MANRILIGNRATGGYGLYVSRPVTTGSGNDVLDCANDKLMFNTNSGESGSSFFSTGHFQIVPISGGTGSSAPVVSSEETVSTSADNTVSYQSIASTKVMAWASKATARAPQSATSNNYYGFNTPGSTSVTLANNGTQSSITLRVVAINMLDTTSLF